MEEDIVSLKEQGRSSQKPGKCFQVKEVGSRKKVPSQPVCGGRVRWRRVGGQEGTLGDLLKSGDGAGDHCLVVGGVKGHEGVATDRGWNSDTGCVSTRCWQ